jgi:stringent starvation protein A
VDLKNKPEDLIRQNPYGKVPVLVDGDGIIYESAIIDEYLEEKFPQVRLMPADLLLRARARIWVDYMSTRLHAAASDITHNREPDKARECMKQHLTALDQEMSGRKYLVGDYSLADVSFIPFYTRQERYGVTIDDQYPNLKRWGEDLIARPKVAPTI